MKNNDYIMEKTIWKGYNFDELRYQRALTVIKCEMEKEKLNGVIDVVRQGGFPLFGNGARHGLMNKMLGALDFADYSFLAFKLGRKLYKLFSRRNK